MPSGARPLGAASFSIVGANEDPAERGVIEGDELEEVDGEEEEDDIELGDDELARAVDSRVDSRSGSRILLQPDAAAMSTPHA
jgi:hypothetical protein